jgi:hypothetical protein
MEPLAGYFRDHDSEEGGATCAGFVASHIQALTLALWLPLHILAIYVLSRHTKPPPARPRRVLEWLVGVVGILLQGLQLIRKLQQLRAIEMANPCHFMILASNLMLLSSNSRVGAYFYGMLRAASYGVFIAIAVGQTESLSDFDKLLFYLEHGWIILTLPLLVSKYEQYRPTSFK